MMNVPAECRTQIFSAHSDTLDHRNLGRRNTGAHWLWYVEHLRADIVVLSAGAHVYGTSRSVAFKGKDRFEVLLNSVWGGYKEALRKFGNVSLVWKTHSPAVAHLIQPSSCHPPITATSGKPTLEVPMRLTTGRPLNGEMPSLANSGQNAT